MRKTIIVNNSTLVSEAQARTAVAALQVQVSRDFAPIWGIDGAYSLGASPVRGADTIYLLDNSDQAGAEGYHDDSAGVEGFVFVKDSIDAGDSWTATLSHEALEQLGDPWINLTVLGQLPAGTGVSRGRGHHAAPVLIAFENCDAVENDEYEINGLPMSNFVTPAWFEMPAPGSTAPPGTKFDFLGKLSAPFSLSPGGYIGYSLAPGAGWQQLNARDTPGHQRTAPRRSRRGRRFLGKNSDDGRPCGLL